MRKKALMNVALVILIAMISAIILYHTVFVEDILQGGGIFSIFLVSMLSHLTIIGRGVFIPIFINFLRYYNPLALGFSSGLGAAIGEITTYYCGLGIKESLQENCQNTQVTKFIKKYGLIAILLVAASPLPDTPIVLLAGTANLPLNKFLAIQILGKTVYYSFSAVAGNTVLEGLSNYMEEWILSAVVLASSLIICVMASWSKGRRWIVNSLRKILH